MPDDTPKHTWHGFSEVPVGFHERALEAGLARATITAPVEISTLGETSVAATLDIVPDDPARADKLAGGPDPAPPVKPAPVVIIEKKGGK